MRKKGVKMTVSTLLLADEILNNTVDEVAQQKGEDWDSVKDDLRVYYLSSDIDNQKNEK